MKQKLLVISLLAIINVHFNEARDLFKITKDAISVGREILKEMKKPIPKDTEIVNVNYSILKILRKFHDAHNVPIQRVYLNIFMAYELESSLILMDYLTKIYVVTRSLPEKLSQGLENQEDLNSFSVNEFFPSSFFLDENVFDLQIFKNASGIMSDRHKLLFKKDPDTGETIMNIFANKSTEWKCWSSSRQQLLYGLLYYIVYQDAFAYIFTQYMYASFRVRDIVDLSDRTRRKLNSIRSTWTQKDVIKRMTNFEEDFIGRNKNTLDQFDKAMTRQSREATSCKNKKGKFDLVEKVEYTKLENVFQIFIANEVDLNVDGTCKNECGNYYQTKQYDCYYDARICNRQRICNGTLWDCATHIDSPMKICLSDEEKESRYEFILTKNRTYGGKHPCPTIITVKNWSRFFYNCEYCTCTCDNINSIGDRYLNGRPVLSDMDANYVISNARFVKENHVIYIQIEEGKLIADGVIHQGTLRWKKLDNFTIFDEKIKEGIDYHTITWNNRKVYLDEFDSPPNSVVTGLQLHSTKGAIKLNIYVKLFDFKTGKLLVGGQWITTTDLNPDERTELKLKNDDDTSDNYKKKYIQFTSSPLISDVGQSTVPYINTEPVIGDNLFRMPFSGAGIIAKSEKDRGSFLALKFLTYNVMENL